MGVLLRSAAIIGVIFYLSPVRNEQPTAGQKQGSDSVSLSGPAGALWQQLPDATKETLANEFRKQLVETATKSLAQEKESPKKSSMPNSGQHLTKEIIKTRPP